MGKVLLILFLVGLEAAATFCLFKVPGVITALAWAVTTVSVGTSVSMVASVGRRG